MADPTYPLYPIFAFLGFILPLIPFPWHLQAWNSGTCFYMIWASLACLNQFVNSVVWHGNALNPAPIWCEISIRIMMGASVGLPAASLCINRRLYKIASIQATGSTKAEKRRQILIDSLICVLFPIVYIALQYVVQGHRFNIYEDIGCYPAVYNSIPTFFLSSMWPIVLGLISAVYCTLSIRAFLRRRAEFSQFLSSNKSLTIGRYFRLMALAMTEMALTTPLAIFMIVMSATAMEVGPWRSWEDTHFDYFRIEQYPSVIWRINKLLVVSVETTRWASPACSIIFFAFFGFAEEAKKHYAMAFQAVCRVFSNTFPSKKQAPLGPSKSVGHSPSATLPSFLRHDYKPASPSKSSFNDEKLPCSPESIAFPRKFDYPSSPSLTSFTRNDYTKQGSPAQSSFNDKSIFMITTNVHTPTIPSSDVESPVSSSSTVYSDLDRESGYHAL